MVRKLFKHEIAAYLRTLLPVQGVLLGIALLGRLVQFFEADNTIYSIINVSSIIVYAVAIIACLVLTSVFGVVRYYKNLFTAEGYLSFTLPVTPSQHIWVKVLAAVMFQFLSIIAVFLSACIMTAGEVFKEIAKAAAYLANLAWQYTGAHIIFYALEIVLLFIVTSFCAYLLYYTCITIGQMARKNRILAAVGVYFAYYMASQFIGTVFTVLTTMFYEFLPLEKIKHLFEAHPFETIHIMLCGCVLLYAILATVYFFITRVIMKKKLNLE